MSFAATTTPSVIAGGAAAAAELLGGERARRRWFGNGRGWIELRIPDGPRAQGFAAIMQRAIGGTAGVERAQVNWPLSRLIVDVGENGPSINQLVLVVEAIERVFAEEVDRNVSCGEPAPEKAVRTSIIDIAELQRLGGDAQDA